MPDQPTTPRVDIGIVVALQEEFRALLDLTEEPAAHPARDLTSLLFTRGRYRCAVTLVGEMGETQAGMFTERLISVFDPGIIVSICIAAGVHGDLRA